MQQTFLIGMGSNIDPERHLTTAAIAIRRLFPGACFSKVYRSAAVGMDHAEDFLNACCSLQSDMTVAALSAWLKELEDEHGRDRSQGSWKPRTLDLDLLKAGENVLDDELFRYAHAYVPAKELVHLPEVELDASLLQVTPILL
jgi:2-amino-4-hydroxy-6-hydroxymethyldihydropteridine diphosphokinase